MRFPLIALALIGVGCADALPEAAPPPPPLAYTSNITYAMPPPSQEHAENAGTKGLLVPGARVEILDTPYLNRPTEIVGFVEAHEEIGQHEAALDELRREAASKGADAVVEVESHKARREGETARLSGVAVRFVRAPSERTN